MVFGEEQQRIINSFLTISYIYDFVFHNWCNQNILKYIPIITKLRTNSFLKFQTLIKESNKCRLFFCTHLLVLELLQKFFVNNFWIRHFVHEEFILYFQIIKIFHRKIITKRTYMYIY